ncbi:hypothetical protein [Pseudomonas fluorescens]|uniref:hypothetical protein n=1 Tax=Pseudomonas fluorescens TaxID=294 RepID=UPI001BE9B427|nr:hypothetical protein [Pseudomonas fluorescens]MBT2374290.1 hypothetical protein [Pseudomonas fluorescens]
MPIDGNSYPNTYNNTSSYANKYQSIAPESQASHGSWAQSSSTPLVNQTPLSSLSKSTQEKINQAKNTKDTLEKLPKDFPIRSLTSEDYQRPVSLIQQKIDKLANNTDSKNPFTKISNHRENKRDEKELNKEMSSLYKKVRDVQLNGTNETDKNRASNVTDTLTVLGRNQPWLQDIRKENGSSQ